MTSVGVLAALALTTAPAAFASSPSNDDRANAELLPSVLQGDVEGDNTGATLEPRESVVDSDGIRWTDYYSVWYRWTAPETRDYRFETCNYGGTEYGLVDSVITVFTARGTKQVVWSDYGDDVCSEQDAVVWFTAQANTTYLIRVSSYSSDDSGDFLLAWMPICDRFIMRVSPTLSWEDARSAAEDLDRDGYQWKLATIGAEWESDCVGRLGRAAGSATTDVWAGGSDVRREGTWEWWDYDPARGRYTYTTFWRGGIDGRARGYTAWQDGAQPDNAGGAQNCLAVNKDNGTWDDLECAAERSYFLEIAGLD